MTPKFRVWDIKNKKFVLNGVVSWGGGVGESGELLIDVDGNFRIAEFPCGNGDNAASSVFNKILNQEDYVLQYFTGLTDAEDKPIYEGDLIEGQTVHWPTDKKTITAQDAIYSDIDIGHVWYCDMFAEWTVSFNHQYSESGCKLNKFDFNRTKVIGNIFENPDIIK